MRIVSLIPSATDIVAGLIDDPDELVGVTHECDWPSWVKDRPKVIGPYDGGILDAAPLEVDHAVSEAARLGRSLYRVDDDLLRRLSPDVIVSQSLCHVCAASPNEVQRAVSLLSRRPRVVELSPSGLSGVLDDIVRVGEAIGQASKARKWSDRLRRRLDWIGSTPRIEPAATVVVIEWPEPLWVAGHWVPEMVELAGGEPLFARSGDASRRIEWREVLEARPDFLVVACCGYDENRNRRQLETLRRLPGWSGLEAVRSGHVFAVDANAYFSRPGPRLVEGAEMLMRLLRGMAVRSNPADYCEFTDV